MATVDLVITFFADRPLMRRLLASRLINPVFCHQAVVEGPQGTAKYAPWVAARGGVVGVVRQAENAARAVGVMKREDRVGRVALAGFSEGNAGVRACLSGPGANMVDSVFSIDGMHSQYVGERKIDLSMLAPWIAFARLAVRDTPNDAQSNGRLFCCTHSMVEPKDFAPVHECAPIVWDQALDAERPEVLERDVCVSPPVQDVACTNRALDYVMDSVAFPNEDLPVGARVNDERRTVVTPDGWSTVRPSAAQTNFLPEATFVWRALNDGLVIRRHANGLHIYGWAYDTPSRRMDPTGNRDHIFQGDIAGPYTVANALAMRWNVQAAAAVSGFGGMPRGLSGGEPWGAQEPKYLPGMGPRGGVTGAVDVIDCPLPNPGHWIVGDELNPCAEARFLSPALQRQAAEEASGNLARALALMAGGAIGWTIAKQRGWRF